VQEALLLFDRVKKPLFDKERNAVAPFDDLCGRLARQCRVPGDPLDHLGAGAAVEAGERQRRRLRQPAPGRCEFGTEGGDMEVDIDYVRVYTPSGN
jgi:hypothetical protein